MRNCRAAHSSSSFLIEVGNVGIWITHTRRKWFFGFLLRRHLETTLKRHLEDLWRRHLEGTTEMNTSETRDDGLIQKRRRKWKQNGRPDVALGGG